MNAYAEWQGRKVRNIKTGNHYSCWDVRDGYIFLSGGQIVPFDAIPGHWELVKDDAWENVT